MNFKEIKKRKRVKDVLNVLDVQSWRKYTGINSMNSMKTWERVMRCNCTIYKMLRFLLGVSKRKGIRNE